MVCGGDYYDRDVYSAPAPSSSSSGGGGGGGGGGGVGGFSYRSAQVFQNIQKMSAEVNPRRFSTNKLSTNHSNPIIVSIDVTGSMGDWTKVIYDKLPMYYGQIMMQKYLSDPAISFGAIGDCFADDAPLQVTPFAQGREIDKNLSKFWLEGGGGGGHKESYELSAYFYLHRCEVPNNSVPFYFFSGDELFFPTLKGKHIHEFIGTHSQDVDSTQIFRQLREKFKGNVFLLKKPYWHEGTDEKIYRAWAEVLGGTSHILEMKEAKSVVDVMLGAIALVSKTRNLKEYIQDMKNRNQSGKRINEVREAILELSCEISGSRYNGGGSKFGKMSSGKEPLFVDFTGLEDDGEDDDDDDDDDEMLLNMGKSEYKNIVSKLIMTQEIKDLKQKLEEEKKKKKDQFPKELLCPITMEVMVDPVITDDGHTYERIAILKWLENNDTSPMTNQKLKSKELRPNHALRKLIHDLTQ